ncbi:hypothetical protein B0H13DRAFT_1896245 [Mycena leptocephala]|nr:hypothetical protein B0H13DRAFT_1896245 [Mycena leptocephala]
MADHHYNMPGGLGNEGDSMSTQNSRHSRQSVSSSTPTLPSGSTPVPAAFEEARPGSAISIQSFHSFQPSPRGSHQHNAATPHQLGQYHASPEPGHGAMQARQLARYSPADGQQSAQYSPAHGQQSAQYSPAHGQQSTAYDVQAQQSALYSPVHGQQSTAYDVQARQSALYSPAHGQQSTAYDMQAQQSALYSPAHGQQSTAYDVQAQQSMVYDMQAQQGGGHSPAHGQQSALYSPAHGQQSTAYDVQAQQSMMYDSWNVWGTAGDNPGPAQQSTVYSPAGDIWAQQGGGYGQQGGGYASAGDSWPQSPGLQSNPTANEFPPRIDLRNPPASCKRRIEIEENGKRRLIDGEPEDVRELRNDLEYEKDMRAHAKGKMKEVQRDKRTLQEELVASRRALRDIAETTNGQMGMYDALRVSHEQAMDELRRAGVDALKAQREQFERHLEDTVAKLRGEYANDLGQERAQNEVRFAAVAARQVRPSSRFAPYHTSEAENARQNRLLKEARQELDKHPGVVVIPRQTPDDGDDESEEETFDEAQKQQAVLAWAWAQIEKEKKRNKEPESDDEGGIAKDLERARKSQQESLSQKEDKAYKKMVRNVFGKATGIWASKDSVDYKPASVTEMHRSRDGEAVPPKDGWRFYFGKGFTSCTHNRLLIDRLVDETLATVACEGILPEVTKGYIRALHYNGLKGAQFHWSLRQARADETKNDAKQRAEEWEEERRLKTNSTSRKTRKRERRMATAKRMKKIRLQEGQPEAAEIFENACDVLKALGNDGMSSEEERVMNIATKSGERKKAMVLAVKAIAWREVTVDKQMKMLDWYRKHQKKRSWQGYHRVRINEVSEAATPLKLPRNLIDPRWLKNEKRFDPEVERTLKIRKPKFELMDFDFNGTDSEDAYEAGDEEEGDADMNSDVDADGEEDTDMEASR